MSRQVPVNADGAANVLQAWDMVHGNVLLRGWTVSDVSFYTTELPQYALVALVRGYDPDVVHVAAAMTYTLLVVLAAVLAAGRATGVEGAVRAAVAVAVMLVPTPERGYPTLLLSPNHTGTCVPLLVTLLVIDRVGARRLPYAVAGLLAWGQIGDPLLRFVGVVPLVLVCLPRLWRAPGGWATRLRGPDGRLALAGVASVVLAKGFLLVVGLLGGFAYFSPPVAVAPLADLGRHVSIAVAALGVLFGADLTDLRGPLAVALGWLHAAAAVAVLATVAVVAVRVLRGRAGDRVVEVAAVAVLVNVAAFVTSTAPVDVGSARQLVAVLPLGAVLAGRVGVPWLLARWRWRPAALARVMAGVLALSAVVFVGQAAGGARRLRTGAAPDSRALVASLAARGLTYGLGGYWNANNVTLETGGRIAVAPVEGRGPILAYHWESRRDWYDAARHDARFLLLDTSRPTREVEAAASAQFGAPVERYTVGGLLVLRYGHNLLDGLRTRCGADLAPATAACAD